MMLFFAPLTVASVNGPSSFLCQVMSMLQQILPVIHHTPIAFFGYSLRTSSWKEYYRPRWELLIHGIWMDVSKLLSEESILPACLRMPVCYALTSTGYYSQSGFGVIPWQSNLMERFWRSLEIHFFQVLVVFCCLP